MSEDRLVDIESKLAHQDQLLQELNDVVTAQQSTIMRLEDLFEALIERVRSIAESSPEPAPPDERPPHY
ncbi:SlyX protein [Gammaproteobacteria bacterium]|jgi:SlyX protein|nr:SlyX protein [Gammaproteobacteria bacterium]